MFLLSKRHILFLVLSDVKDEGDTRDKSPLQDQDREESLFLKTDVKEDMKDPGDKRGTGGK